MSWQGRSSGDKNWPESNNSWGKGNGYFTSNEGLLKSPFESKGFEESKIMPSLESEKLIETPKCDEFKLEEFEVAKLQSSKSDSGKNQGFNFNIMSNDNKVSKSGNDTEKLILNDKDEHDSLKLNILNNTKTKKDKNNEESSTTKTEKEEDVLL